MENIAFDTKLIWDIIQVSAGLIAACLVFMLRKVFVKKEAFEKHKDEVFTPLVLRVQTLEETYVKKDTFDTLEKRVGKIEGAIEGIPELVKLINDELIDLRSTARHMDQTIKRVERPINLIVEAAMRGSSNGAK
jgi:hypothetical protein